MPSINKLQVGVNSTHETIRSYILSKQLFRGGWYFTNFILDSSISSNTPAYNFLDQTKNVLFKEILNSYQIRKAVFLFDAESNKFIKRYDDVMQCAKDLKMLHNTITNAIKNNKRLGKYIFSSHRILNKHNNQL